jgi:hypothetical protein
MQIQNSVGESGENDPLDVSTVQGLLSQNADQLAPAAPVDATGVCDDQTIFLI